MREAGFVISRAAVSMEIDRFTRLVRLTCLTHGLEQLVPLHAPRFGEQIVAFFSGHEQCSKEVELPE